ncbi:MAG: UDP-3-O-(3-hydroxymyristoyl)glucosamine N-acyltransferase [Desulfobacterales bacterium]|nr:UDP-3-O-(3-hydroxymyristoyl)glucosamine N-acyltransferase [Desulfobacterales bacterium]MBF0396691.1 UDP-3-O-(3-hydroxymyristoyl)glucosamine N-acyltransferase [Desulfobacterales bacterium]
MELSLGEVTKLVSGNLIGNPDKKIYGVAPFENSTELDITYAAAPKFLKQIENTHACAVIVPKSFKEGNKFLIQADNPQIAFIKVLSAFHKPLKPRYTISESAYIGKNVILGKNVSIGPCAVIQDNVKIGDRVTIHPGTVIGNDVQIGDDTLIYPNVTILDRCILGKRIIIHSGTVIGSDGFGFAYDGKMNHKINHIGIVQIDDDVEIGANNTIDRGTFGKTWIKDGVKTDNLVHIAHNVTIGENSIIVAQVGIAGSTKLGKRVILGGQTGVAGHITIGDNVMVAGQSGVSKSVPEGKIVSGTPEMPHDTWLKVQAIIHRLPEMRKKIIDLEKQLNELKAKD